MSIALNASRRKHSHLMWTMYASYIGACAHVCPHELQGWKPKVMARQLDIKGMTPKAFSNGHETAFALVNQWVDHMHN